MENALLVGLNVGNEAEAKYAMDELKSLAEACEYEVAGIVLQTLEHPIPATYIGSGKITEISEIEENMGIGCVIFEDTLSPVQLKNLQKALKARVMDRTGLILEIFSKRARTREAKLQVESANLQYMMPRLIGMWEAIGRQGGASGSKSNKGVGETQLELDRRWIQKRITEVKRELDAIEHDRDIQRRKREKGRLPLVALVGYTNAGKSTIMNRLVGRSKSGAKEKLVFEKDMLFATLDTSVRRIETGNKKDFLLSDTVGFLDKLPHSLIKAFRSTLDEIKYADLLVEVVDMSDDKHDDQMRVTMETLRELGAETIPCIHVMNKADKCDEDIEYPRINGDRIYISAASGRGIDELTELIQQRVYESNTIEEYLIPYNAGAAVNALNEKARVIETEYRNEGIYIKADVPQYMKGQYEKYEIV